MKPRLVDTHCHLQFAAYQNQAAVVIKRTLDAGIWMIVVGTDLESSKQAVDIAQKYPVGVYSAIGLHPTDADHVFDKAAFATLISSGRVVAVGEIGLDYYRLPTDSIEQSKKLQQDLFRQQINFARENHLPIIVHVRAGSAALNAHHDALEILQTEINENGPITGVMHCFSGTLEDALRYIELGFYISFTGNITYPPRKGEGSENPLLKIARRIPLDRILVETDAPYLAPVPFRGQTNEPLYVEHVAAAIAQARSMPVDKIALQTTENALGLFNIAS